MATILALGWRRSSRRTRRTRSPGRDRSGTKRSPGETAETLLEELESVHAACDIGWPSYLDAYSDVQPGLLAPHSSSSSPNPPRVDMRGPSSRSPAHPGLRWTRCGDLTWRASSEPLVSTRCFRANRWSRRFAGRSLDWGWTSTRRATSPSTRSGGSQEPARFLLLSDAARRRSTWCCRRSAEGGLRGALPRGRPRRALRLHGRRPRLRLPAPRRQLGHRIVCLSAGGPDRKSHLAHRDSRRGWRRGRDPNTPERPGWSCCGATPRRSRGRAAPPGARLSAMPERYSNLLGDKWGFPWPREAWFSDVELLRGPLPARLGTRGRLAHRGPVGIAGSRMLRREPGCAASGQAGSGSVGPAARRCDRWLTRFRAPRLGADRKIGLPGICGENPSRRSKVK